MPTEDKVTSRQDLRLLVEEGWQEVLRDNDARRPASSALSCAMRVPIADAPDPELWTVTDGRVIVTGMPINGSTIAVASNLVRLSANDGVQ